MNKDNIFIHIPKTGGSSFIKTLECNLLNIKKTDIDITHRTKNVKNISIKHLDFSHPKRIMCDNNIFNDYELYNKFNIFMIIRNPLDRLISEFIFQYHILNSRRCAKIINSLNPKPNNFLDYIKHKEVWNYQLAFLSGRGVADLNKPTQDDLDKIIKYIDKYPVYCGITEEYDKFIKLFNNISKHDIKDIYLMKESPNDIKEKIIETLTPEIIDYIKDTNSLDYKLYEYVKTVQQQYPSCHPDLKQND